MEIFLSVLAGFLLNLAFPPFNLFFIAWFALIPLLIAVNRAKDKKQAFLFGFLFGSVFFAGVLFWVNTLIEWAGIWAVFGFIILVAFQALFIGLFSVVVFYINQRPLPYNIFLIPFNWSFIEWLRSLGPYGVTAGGLGYSQIDFLLLAQTARIAGIYGISFLIVLFNTLIFYIIVIKGKWTERLKVKTKEILFVSLILIVALVYGAVRLNHDYKTGKSVKISVIQAAIPQDVKLDFGQTCAIVDFHEILSDKALRDEPYLIIWPETAVTTYINLASNIQEQIEKMTKRGNAKYLIGTSYTTGGKNYNSVVAYSSEGKLLGRYNKYSLVPFGEYLPLRPIIYPLLKGIGLLAEDYHSDSTRNIIDLKTAKVGVVICFESTFPYLVRDKVRKGADFIVVATNDAWFGDSSALDKHLISTRMRAIENGIYVVQAANTGISAIIDPAGRVVKRTDIGEEDILFGEVFF